MKYLPLLVIALLFASCKNPVIQRDAKIASSIKIYFDSIVHTIKMQGNIDSVKVSTVDSITDTKRLGVQMDCVRAIEMKIGADSELASKNQYLIQLNEKELDSLKAVKTNNEFWGYHVKATVYSRGFDKPDAEVDEMLLFVSKDFKASVDPATFMGTR